ncbi:MAG: SprT family zinc-dependent metalloprotease [Cyanobacteria bacterium P01_C01_bin.72]
MKIADLEVAVVRKNIKNLYIRIYPPNGLVKVVCPHKLDDDTIRQFVRAKISWINQQQTKFQAQPPQPRKQYITGESCYFKGDRYLLNVIYHQAAPKVILEAKHLNLYVRYGSIEEQRQQALTSWYRQQLKSELPSLIAKWEEVIGVKINDWGVKKMKTRWGTCNTRAKRIWLNLELVKKPQHCLEYVIVHELVHLLERQHNERFWGYVSQFMPQWQEYQRELNHFP